MQTSGPSNIIEKANPSLGIELYYAIDNLDELNVKRILASESLPAWEDIKPESEVLCDDFPLEGLLRNVVNRNQIIFDQIINAYFESFNPQLIRTLLTLLVENNHQIALCQYLPYSFDALTYHHFNALISFVATNRNINIINILLQEASQDSDTLWWTKSAINEVLTTAIRVNDIDFLNGLLKIIPMPLIQRQVPLALEKACNYYQNQHDIIKVLLSSPISDESRISRLISVIMQNKLNLVQLILPTISSISDGSLLSVIQYSRRHKDIYQILKAHYKVQLVKIFNEQLASFNVTDNVTHFSKLIFLPRQNAMSFKDPWAAGISTATVYNNDHYPTSQASSFYAKKGRALSLQIKHQSSPIGYTIQLPTSAVKAVIIDVYGGDSKKSIEDFREKSKEFVDKAFELEPRLDNRLREEGIAVVYTNLCDLLELNVSQSQMPESLFRKIHRSIHCLYEILQDCPESLHPELASLKGLPFFLRGASFGGLMSVRYAQLATQYPHQFRRFQGYLSFNGALSAEMLYNSDLLYLYEENRYKRRDYRADFLNPYNHVAFIEDPILITHCLDDNNVNVKVAFDFAQKAQALGKSHLVRLQLVQNGNTMLKNYPFGSESAKGHLAVDRFQFKTYSDAVLQFLRQPIATLPEVSSWREFYGNIKANEYYRQATPEERLSAHIIKRRNAQQTTELISEIQDDETWHTHYIPLYLAYHYAHHLCSSHAELAAQTQLFNEHYLTDEVIINAFHEKAPELLAYFFEAHDIADLIFYDINIDEFIRLPLIIHAIRETLQQINHNFHDDSARFLLEQLYVHNPHLLPPSFGVASCSTDAVRGQLINMLQKNRGHILSLWKKTIAASKATNVRQNGASTSYSDDANRKHSLASRLSYDRECKRQRF